LRYSIGKDKYFLNKKNFGAEDSIVTKNNKCRKKQGRPSKLTPELHAEMVLLFKMGNFVETACKTVGINKSTYYDWIKKGKKCNFPQNKYKIFKDAVDKAMAYSEARDVAIIAKHSEDKWTAATWMLSRRFPERWGKNVYKDFDLDIDELDEDHIAISKEEYAGLKKVLYWAASQQKDD
jgi:transposase